jgi:hypothetical protein
MPGTLFLVRLARDQSHGCHLITLDSNKPSQEVDHILVTLLKAPAATS